MLKLRRGRVVGVDPLLVEVGEETRPAWADAGLLGAPRLGDDVVVNVEAVDLGLGSGGFDIVHANLTSGLTAGDAPTPGLMKLNYTSLQHSVETIEVAEPDHTARPAVLVLMLHGQLAPAAWAFAQTGRGLRVGFIQTPGGALPGALSRTVAELRAADLLAGHVTAGASFGGEKQAISTVGALNAAAEALGWDAVLVGPGPGIVGSDTAYGHGGMVALDNAHAALALGMPTFLSARMSSADPRERHRGVSHHTLTVLSLLLRPVRIAVSGAEAGMSSLRQAATTGGHEILERPAGLKAYSASGLPAETMGRTIEQDPDFFSAPLAAGVALAEEAAAAAP
jgi:Protein of unknown function (DUF3866)